MRAFIILMFVSISISVTAQSRELSTYFDNGNLKSRYEYANSQNYAFTNFFLSGKVMETGSFVNGKKDGTWITFNESGVKTAEAFYKLGEKTGEWKIFDELGNLKYKVAHDANKLTQANNIDSDRHATADMRSK